MFAVLAVYAGMLAVILLGAWIGDQFEHVRVVRRLARLLGPASSDTNQIGDADVNNQS